MKDLEKQLSEGGMSAHDLEKTKKKLEMEKEELNAALEVRGMPKHCSSYLVFVILGS